MSNADVLTHLDQLCNWQAGVRRNAIAMLGLDSEASAFDLVEPLIYSDDQKVRDKAVFGLTQLDPDRALPLFISIIPTVDAPLRAEIIHTMSQAAYPGDGSDPDLDGDELAKHIALFIGLLKDESDEVRAAAAGILGSMENPEAVEPLIAVLNDEDEQVRYSAAQSLGWLRDKRAVEPLIAALSGEPQHYYYIVATSLQYLGDTRAVPALVRLLTYQLEHFTLNATVDALEHLGGRKAVLATTDAAIIDQAYDTMLRIYWGQIENAPELGLSIAAMRGAAAKALGILGGDKAVDTLRDAIPLNEGNLLVQRYAVTGLGHTQSKRAIEILKKLAQGRDTLAMDANKAFSLVSDDDAVQSEILDWLNSADMGLQMKAVNALAEMKGEWAFNTALDVFQNKPNPIRMHALKAMTDNDPARASDIILAAMRNDPDPRMRETLVQMVPLLLLRLGHEVMKSKVLPELREAAQHDAEVRVRDRASQAVSAMERMG